MNARPSIEDLLNHHAELLARGHRDRAAELAAGASAELDAQGLLALAAQVHEVLRPVRPNPAFLHRLQEGLMAVAANHLPAPRLGRARWKPHLRLRRLPRPRRLPVRPFPRPHRPGLHRPAPSDRLAPLVGRSAAVALLSLVAIWWLERP